MASKRAVPIVSLALDVATPSRAIDPAYESRVVDEFLPTTGVAVNDIFWVTVDGPSEVAGLVSGTAIAAGDRVCCVASANSTGLTAGRVGPSLLSAASTAAGDAGLGVIGYAMSASSTSATTMSTGLGSPLCLVKAQF